MKTNPNDKYPNISKFASELLNKNSGVFEEYCKLSELEAFLAKGVVVYGHEPDFDEKYLTVSKLPTKDTHSGLLIGYQPIESSEPVSKDELDEVIDYLRGYVNHDHKMIEKLERIKRNGVR